MILNVKWAVAACSALTLLAGTGPATATTPAAAPSAAHITAEAPSRAAAVVRPVATLSTNYALLSNGKVQVSIDSNAKKVKLTWRTAKNTKRAAVLKVRGGEAGKDLPKGAKRIYAQALATSKLRRSVKQLVAANPAAVAAACANAAVPSGPAPVGPLPQLGAVPTLNNPTQVPVTVNGFTVYRNSSAPWASTPQYLQGSLLEVEVWAATGLTSRQLDSILSTVLPDDHNFFQFGGNATADNNQYIEPRMLATYSPAQLQNIARAVCERGGTLTPRARQWRQHWGMQVTGVKGLGDDNARLLMPLLPPAVLDHADFYQVGGTIPMELQFQYSGPPLDGPALEAVAALLYQGFTLPNPTTDLEWHRGEVMLTGVATAPPLA